MGVFFPVSSEEQEHEFLNGHTYWVILEQWLLTGLY